MIRPSFMYGTAWKEAETRRLVGLAIRVGFRAIDTANQRKHYFEAAVGEGLADAYASGLVHREELFLQTKFTYLRGQDERLPYDPRAPLSEQLAQSFESSLEHLGTDYLDSYVLHGPSSGRGLEDADWEVWKAMERLVIDERVRVLGISNVHVDQLRELCETVRIKPGFVQNRCYARDGWDRATREYCREQGITYQGFSLLTANQAELRRPRFLEVVRRTGKTAAQVVFRFAMQVGMLPLTGSSSEQHLREDLALDFELAPADVAVIEAG
jgi:diketogulonate reductase-like aldo/keto reductase